MSSRAITERIKHAESLFNMVSAHELELYGPLGNLFRVDAGVLIEAHLDVVRDAQQKMLDADDAVTAEANDDQQYRDARDQAVEKLSATLQDTRMLLEAAYDVQTGASYHFAEELPRSPRVLAEGAAASVEALRTQPLSGPSPYGFDLDLAPLADRIETELIPLELALEDVAREAREIREALDVRNEVMADFDEIYRAIARIIHSYFVLVGRPDLAAMIS